MHHNSQEKLYLIIREQNTVLLINIAQCIEVGAFADPNYDIVGYAEGWENS